MRIPASLAFACLVLLAPASAQERAGPFRVEVVNVDLGAALRAFSEATGTAVAYDPELTRGRRVTCAVRTSDIEVYLGCLLAESGLEFFRRASGTYVVGEPVALPAAFGLLTGNVGDSDDAQPLGFAHIIVEGMNRGAVSEPSGRFLVADLLPGRYAVAVSHVGYGTWSDSVDVVPGATTRIRPLLQRRVVEVEPVVVEHSGTALHPLRRDHEMVPSAVRAPSGLSGALADMTARLHLQGSDAGDLQMRLDGHPVYLPRDLLGFFGPFASSAISAVRLGSAGFGAAGGSLLGGVLDFRQRTDWSERVALSVDPYQVEASAATPARSGQPGLRVSMRTSLYDQTSPDNLRTTLEEWSRVDPFVLFAPNQDYTNITEDAAERLFNLRDASPSVDFLDLHAVGTHATTKGDWRASIYRASRSLSGDRRRTFSDQALASDTPFVSSVASHDWSTLTAALDWRGLLGQRTFASGGARLSRYRYTHQFGLAELRSGDFLAPGTEGDETRFELGTSADGNDLDEYALTVRLDHARRGHMFSGGMELVHSSSAFDLRLASTAVGQDIGVVLTDPGGLASDTLSVFLTRHATLHNSASSTRPAWWLSDRYQTERFTLESGVRLTYRLDRRTLYAEPRLQIAMQVHPDLVAAFSGGLYRQFVNQFDHSTLNAGEFVPSTRLWLPLDKTLRPPRALHGAVDVEWAVLPGWEIAGSAYVKRIDGGLVVNYALPPGLVSDGQEVSQDLLLTRRDALHQGASLQVSRSGTRLSTSIRYRYAHDRIQSDALYAGRTLQAPWSIPHRVDANLQASLGPASLSARAAYESGMKWVFRQAYYDYFGAIGGSHVGWDLGRPDLHGLPSRLTVDLGLGLGIPVSRGSASLRLEVRNVLDRRNELDRRLLWNGSALSPDARYLPGRTVALGARLAL